MCHVLIGCLDRKGDRCPFRVQCRFDFTAYDAWKQLNRFKVALFHIGVMVEMYTTDKVIVGFRFRIKFTVQIKA